MESDLNSATAARDRYIRAVVSDSRGRIFDLEDYAAVGMAGTTLTPLKASDTVKIPFGSELMYLPDRKPVVFHVRHQRFETLDENPREPSEKVFPVAAFNSPGYVNTHVSAYEEAEDAGPLPLFAYGAAGWYRGGFKTAAIQVDRERRQDLRLMKKSDVIAGVDAMRRSLPANRLERHLETCALGYGCPAAKNFFLGRYEAPLPTATTCNARCLGCLSLQTEPGIPCSQERIRFTPSAQEIADVALTHIRRVRRAIVSFGQGCEGDPLMAAEVIEPAIRLIREQTAAGTIHMNTNGSRPRTLERLFAAGLDSIRISLNSVRPVCYHAYFRPAGYTFSEVVESIRLARDRRRYVALNYLNLPGFTDTPPEIDSLVSFLKNDGVDMIQWRNLNFDPARYLRLMGRRAPVGKPVGMAALLERLRREFPALRHGYFNPPKESFRS